MVGNFSGDSVSICLDLGKWIVVINLELVGFIITCLAGVMVGLYFVLSV